MAAVTAADISDGGYHINPSFQGSDTDTYHLRYSLNGNFVILSNDLDDFIFECRLSATLSAILGATLGTILRDILDAILGAILGAIPGAILRDILGAIQGAITGAILRDTLGDTLGDSSLIFYNVLLGKTMTIVTSAHIW